MWFSWLKIVFFGHVSPFSIVSCLQHLLFTPPVPEQLLSSPIVPLWFSWLKILFFCRFVHSAFGFHGLRWHSLYICPFCVLVFMTYMVFFVYLSILHCGFHDWRWHSLYICLFCIVSCLQHLFQSSLYIHQLCSFICLQHSFLSAYQIHLVYYLCIDFWGSVIVIFIFYSHNCGSECSSLWLLSFHWSRSSIVAQDGWQRTPLVSIDTLVVEEGYGTFYGTSQLVVVMSLIHHCHFHNCHQYVLVLLYYVDEVSCYYASVGRARRHTVVLCVCVCVTLFCRFLYER